MIDYSYDTDWDEDIAKYKKDGLTYLMGFQLESEVTERPLYNIFIAVYRKRKHAESNESNLALTGENPIDTFIFARRSFETLLHRARDRHPNVPIKFVVRPTNFERKSVYYKYLKRYGFYYGRDDGRIALIKILEPNENIT